MEVSQVELGDHTITLHCHSTLDSSVCPSCLQKCNFVKDSYTRELRDLSISGKKVKLLFTVRQFVCKDCNRHFHERYSFAPKNSSMTQRYEDFIYYRCQGVDLRYVSIQEDITWPALNRIFEKHAKLEIKKRNHFSNAIHIGMDEIALKKGHKDFVAVLVNLATGEIMDILADRSKEYLKKYFLSKGDAFCQQIECFCSDMWEGYLNCAKEVFPNATIIADRFHFFAYLNKEVDKCRRAMRRKYRDDQELKHLKWLLLKPKEHLSDEALEQLMLVLDNPKYELLKRTWQARNQFRDILEMNISRDEAQIKIQQWQEKQLEQPNRFVKRFVDFFLRWKNYILNYFTYRHTTSLIEGINNKLKLIKRKAYGFLTFQGFKLRAMIEF